MRKHSLAADSCEQRNLEALLQSFQKILDESYTLIETDDQRIKILSDFITNINQFYDRYLPYLRSEISLYHTFTKYLFRHLKSFILGLDSEEIRSQSKVKKVVKARLNLGFEKSLILKHIDFDGLLENFFNQSFRDNEKYHNHLIQFSLLVLQIICHQSGGHLLSHQILFDVTSSMMVLTGAATLPAKCVSGNQVLRQHLESKGVGVDSEVCQLLYPQLNERRKMMAVFALVLFLGVIAVAPSKAYLGLIPLAVLALIEVFILQHVHQGVSKWSQGGPLIYLIDQPFDGEDFSLLVSKMSGFNPSKSGVSDEKCFKHSGRP